MWYIYILFNLCGLYYTYGNFNRKTIRINLPAPGFLSMFLQFNKNSCTWARGLRVLKKLYNLQKKYKKCVFFCYKIFPHGQCWFLNLNCPILSTEKYPCVCLYDLDWNKLTFPSLSFLNIKTNFKSAESNLIWNVKGSEILQV